MTIQYYQITHSPVCPKNDLWHDPSHLIRIVVLKSKPTRGQSRVSSYLHKKKRGNCRGGGFYQFVLALCKNWGSWGSPAVQLDHFLHSSPTIFIGIAPLYPISEALTRRAQLQTARNGRKVLYNSTTAMWKTKPHESLHQDRGPFQIWVLAEQSLWCQTNIS